MITSLELLFLGAALASVLTGVGILLINPNRSVNRIFVLVSAASAFWFFCVFMAVREARDYTPTEHNTHIFWLRISSVSAATLPWLIQLMIKALAFPNLSLIGIFRQSSPWLLMVVVLGVLVFSESFIPSNSVPTFPKRGYGYTIYFWTLMIQGIALIIVGYRQMRILSGARRIEMKVFALCTAVACLTALSLSYLGRTFSLPILSRSGPLVFLILYAFTVWAVSYHRIFDARQVIASLAHRILLLGIVGTIAASSIILLDDFIEAPYNILLVSVSAGILALAIEKPTLRPFGLDHEHRLSAHRKTIIAWARQISETDKLKSIFERFLRNWGQTDRAILLFAHSGTFTAGTEINLSADWPGFAPLCKEGWCTPELLQRRKISQGTSEIAEFMGQHELGVLLAVPVDGDTPTLLVALGQKRSLRPYTYPDVRLLIDLAELMDNILTHASLSAHAAKIAQMESAAMISRSLAHDLNNLTTPVATYLLHTQGRATPGSAEAEVYDAALHSVKVMHDYIRESLFFSKSLIPFIFQKYNN